MAIKTYNSVQYTDVCGRISSSLQNEEVKGFYVYDVNSPKLASKAFSRMICSCGYVDAVEYTDAEKWECPKCHNNKFHMVQHHYYYHKNKEDFRCTPGSFFISDKNILVSREYDIRFVPKQQEIEVQQVYVYIAHLAHTSSGEIVPICQKAIQPYHKQFYAFEQFISQLPYYGKVKELYQRVFPECVDGFDYASVDNATMYKMLSVLNHLCQMVVVMPFLSSLNTSMLKAVVDLVFASQSFSATILKKCLSIDEFCKEFAIHKDFIDILPLIAGEKNDFEQIENLEKPIVMAVKNAIIHGYTTLCEVNNMLKYRPERHISFINTYAAEFAEFVRKNIVVYGSNTIDAFLYVKEYESKTMKESTLKKFEYYLQTKKFKQEKIKQFEDLLLNGDGIGALEALT